MTGRILDVTAHTTFDYLEVQAIGNGWIDETVGVLDVESPRGKRTVTFGLESDPADLHHIEHHAESVTLTPDQARSLAEELREAASAAERGDAMSSRRR
ncbi:hypothetical protein EA462_11525 [Natrarchaeobius halalkaliphilus]|uniref:Uncharacterized protein n=1 Tax=Natrarchaeobius halalkaliphilus TaxID=1679091 RepID=A0A3N6LK92_9EURY|nr:hypothetical protein EA462_11525 [Natrarchaeobius halalkaliphilus]